MKIVKILILITSAISLTADILTIIDHFFNK